MRGPSMRHGAAIAVMMFILLVAGPAVAFCGFYVSGADGKLFNNATMVAMMREGQRTVLSMQNNYQGPPEDFAMVVPVPVVLQKENVKTLPASLFDRLDKLAAPRLVEYWEQDPCSVGAYGRGDMMAPQNASPARASKAKDEEGGVKVEAQFAVGEYEVVILSASDSSGLDTWLKDQGYNIPDGAEPLLRPYVEDGSKFFVAKVDLKKVKKVDGRPTLSPLRFHYDTDKFSLPVRLGLMNSNGTQDLIVHILARNQRYEVANYENVTIPTNINVRKQAQDKFGEFYAALFDATVTKNKGAVVTEYAWDSSTCDPCPVPGLRPHELASLGLDVLDGKASDEPMDPLSMPVGPPRRSPFGFVLTRLHARYGKDSLGEDLVFKKAEPIVGGREIRKSGKLEHGSSKGRVNNFQGRYAIRHAWEGSTDCKDPKFGVWGGPPKGKKPNRDVASALNLAFAKREGVQLASMIRSPVPELALEPAKAAKKEPDPSSDDAGEPATDAGGACGCEIAGGHTSDGWLVALWLAALGWVRRMRR